MLGRLKKFLRLRDGVAALELGLVTPIFLLMFLSVTELGHMIYYSITIEKGLRSGITYLARAMQNGVEPTEEMKTITRNLVMRGTLGDTDPFLVTGFGQAVGDFVPLDEIVVVSTHTYTQSIPGETIIVDVATVDVYVPYVPLMPFVTNNIMGTFSPTIHLRHEQAVIGN